LLRSPHLTNPGWEVAPIIVAASVGVVVYKTGNATLTAVRIAQIRAHLPWYAQNVPIIVIRGR
jgi:hypothetical protein